MYQIYRTKCKKNCLYNIFNNCAECQEKNDTCT